MLIACVCKDCEFSSLCLFQHPKKCTEGFWHISQCLRQNLLSNNLKLIYCIRQNLDKAVNKYIYINILICVGHIFGNQFQVFLSCHRRGNSRPTSDMMDSQTDIWTTKCLWPWLSLAQRQPYVLFTLEILSELNIMGVFMKDIATWHKRKVNDARDPSHICVSL